MQTNNHSQHSYQSREHEFASPFSVFRLHGIWLTLHPIRLQLGRLENEHRVFHTL